MTVTVADVLGSGDAFRVGPALQRGLERAETAADAVGPTVAGFGATLLRAVDERIAAALQEQLAIDVGAEVLKGWGTFAELLAAARRTRDAPGEPEEVGILTHEITSPHHPTVDVLVDGIVRATLTFDLVLTLELRGVVAVVERGSITALRAGDVTASADLSLDGNPLLHGAKEYRVGVLVPLGSGIVLVAPAPAAAPPIPAQAAAPASPGSPWWERSAAQRRA